MSPVPGEMWHTLYLRCNPLFQERITRDIEKFCNAYSNGITDVMEFARDWNMFARTLEKLKMITTPSRSNFSVSLLYDYYHKQLMIHLPDDSAGCKIPIHLPSWEHLIQLELLLFQRATIVIDVEDRGKVIRLLQGLRPKSSLREVIEVMSHLHTETETGRLERLRREVMRWVSPDRKHHQLAIQYVLPKEKQVFRFILTTWMNANEGKSAYIKSVELSDKEYGIRGMNVSTILNTMFKVLHKEPIGPNDLHIVVGIFVLPEETCTSLFRQFQEFIEEHSTDDVSVDDFNVFYRSIQRTCELSLSEPRKQPQTFAITFIYDAPIKMMACAMHWQEKDKVAAHDFRLDGDASSVQSVVFHTSTIVFYTDDTELSSRGKKILVETPVVSQDSMLTMIGDLLKSPSTSRQQLRKNTADQHYLMITSQPHDGSCHMRVTIGNIRKDRGLDTIAEKYFVIPDTDDCHAIMTSIRKLGLPHVQQLVQQKQQPLPIFSATKTKPSRRRSVSTKKKSSVSSKKKSSKRNRSTSTKLKTEPASVPSILMRQSSSSSSSSSQTQQTRPTRIFTDVGSRQIIQRLPKPNQDQSFTRATQDNIQHHVLRELVSKQIASQLLTSAYRIKASYIIVIDGPNLTFQDHPAFHDREKWIASKEFSEWVMNMHKEKNAPIVFFIISQKNLPPRAPIRLRQKLVCVKSHKEVLNQGVVYRVVEVGEDDAVGLRSSDGLTIRLPRDIVEQHCIDAGYEDYVDFTQNKDRGDKNHLFFYGRVGCYDALQKKNCFEAHHENECDDYVRKDTLRRLRLMIRTIRKQVVDDLDRNKQFMQTMQRISTNPYSTLRRGLSTLQNRVESFREQEYYLKNPSVMEISGDKGRNWRYKLV